MTREFGPTAKQIAAVTDGPLIKGRWHMIRLHGGGLAVWENNDKSWLAYRRKPEEVKAT